MGLGKWAKRAAKKVKGWKWKKTFPEVLERVGEGMPVGAAVADYVKDTAVENIGRQKIIKRIDEILARWNTEKVDEILADVQALKSLAIAIPDADLRHRIVNAIDDVIVDVQRYTAIARTKLANLKYDIEKGVI